MPLLAAAPAPHRLLLVEDHDETRAYAVEWLTAAGYGVRAVATVEEAFTAMQEEDFCLYVLDQELPFTRDGISSDSGGRRILETIRKADSRRVDLAHLALRPMLDKLVAAFKLAAESNQALLSEYPGLATLLGAKTQIAQRAVSTKRLNKKAVAEGKPPYHGAVGKKRQRQAEKAAAAAQASGSAGAPTPVQPATTPATPATPATSTAH